MHGTGCRPLPCFLFAVYYLLQLSGCLICVVVCFLTYPAAVEKLLQLLARVALKHLPELLKLLN